MPEKNEADLMSAEDRAFARSVRARREAIGWSQGELANRLQEAGFPWLTRNAVVRLEGLKRASRLGEARAIADLLDTPLGVMIASDAHLSAAVLARPAVVSQALDAFYDRAEELGEQLGLVAEERASMLSWLKGADGREADREVVERLRAYVDECDALAGADVPERVLKAFAAGRERYGAAADTAK